MKVKVFLIRLKLYGTLAECNHFLCQVALFQEYNCFSAGLQIEAVKTGADWHNPRFCRKLRQEIPAIKDQCTAVFCKAFIPILLRSTQMAKRLKIIHIKLEWEGVVPGIGSVPANDQLLSCIFVQSIQHVANPVKHCFQCIYRLCAFSVFSPEQRKQFLLRDGAVSEINHIGEKLPCFSGAVFLITDFPFPKGK